MNSPATHTVWIQATVPRAPFLLRNLFGAVCVWTLMGCHFDEVITRFDKPTPPSALALSGDFPVALPRSAKNMYYCEHVGGTQELERYVRIEIDPGDIESAVRAIAKWDIAGENDISFYERRPLNPADFMKPVSQVSPIAWWRLGDIRNGFSYVKKDHTRHFWIDSDRNLIFFFETD
jgi:hypothetical protein